MINFSFESPPEDLSVEVRQYLERQFSLIMDVMQSASDLNGISGVPDKVSDGMIRYASSTDATFTSVGFWGLVNGTWVNLSQDNTEAVPANSVMYFGQASAPTGWTQTASNDLMLRVVSGTGGGTGGSVSPIAAHTHTTSSHTLTTAEMPSHYHVENTQAWMNLPGSNYVAPLGTPGYHLNVTSTGRSNANTGSTGSSNSHSHGNTGSSYSPKYKDIIECTKN